ncbi:MAG: hypothetical protein WAO91_04570 [Candidatus Nitrosotenuis sp.]
MRRLRKECSSTGEGWITDEDELQKGYVVENAKIIGEARRYDPYSRLGDIMLYEIDSFGFVSGYVGRDLQVMSEEDILQDDGLRKSLEVAKYEVWKRHNIVDLIKRYDRMFRDRDHFELFCKQVYKKIDNDDKSKQQSEHDFLD